MPYVAHVVLTMKEQYIGMYSGTSDSGPSEIGKQYNRSLYKGHTVQGPKNLVPNTF